MKKITSRLSLVVAIAATLVLLPAATLLASTPARQVLFGPGAGVTLTSALPAASSASDIVLDTVATRTAGNLLDIRSNGVSKIKFDFNGRQIPSTFATTKTALSAAAGKAALDTSGTVTITTTAVGANSVVFLQRLLDGGTVGGLYTVKSADITAGTSFIIRSFVASTAGAATAATSDTSTIGWFIVN